MIYERAPLSLVLVSVVGTDVAIKFKTKYGNGILRFYTDHG